METTRTAQQSLAVPVRSAFAVALVETGYLLLRLSAIAVLAAPVLVAAALLLG
jgi:hypothetical protein